MVIEGSAVFYTLCCVGYSTDIHLREARVSIVLSRDAHGYEKVRLTGLSINRTETGNTALVLTVKNWALLIIKR